MQVTISLLPVSLSLVHVPRSRLLQLSHPIIRQILIPSPSFLNLTCNEIELSIFAEHDVLRDFEPIARRDRQKLRSRSGSTSSRRRADPSTEADAVEVSYDKWNVLQIDSHTSGLDNAGARVHELSAPLAAAGISILYQSSYMSDFIFVKSVRLQEVMSILGSAGFDLYSSDPDNLTSWVSPLPSPMMMGTDNGSILDIPDFSSGAVLTRTRSCTDASLSTQASSLMSSLSPLENTIPAISSSTETMSTARPFFGRTKSVSPSSSEVNILEPDLTCVGLADDAADIWALKVIKLVAYPELVVPKTDATLLASQQAGKFSTSLIGKDIRGYHTSAEDIRMGSDDARRSQIHSPASPGFFTPHPTPPRSPSSGAVSSSEGEDGYFSASPHNLSTTSLVSSASRSLEDLWLTASKSSGRKKHDKKGRKIFAYASNRVWPAPLTPGPSSRPHQNVSPGYDVPFFSLTRTTEGSSLTAPSSVLAHLFPQSERHMVICSDELDALDAGEREEVDKGEDGEEDDMDRKNGLMKCLQIDLRQFGLDKHGLVNRYSRVLEENRINHMYSSTFKTANLLVDKAHAERAQALLRAC
ncbi:hypothetical protein EW146_g1449 [Bondarzewia mesenterica]|uniref:CASTOR ACT domain-containing protein n=1 Tax=Bondarzewia mesenterica TaxID=1095465 RepID=A0A4S4M3U6_9AGAM|nr:hypothetical protein EW146_g1449 [Bondarzewia mesenterica]